ncbi:MAG: hypothetical protein ABSH53_05190 [Holophaga sp.]
MAIQKHLLAQDAARQEFIQAHAGPAAPARPVTRGPWAHTGRFWNTAG